MAVERPGRHNPIRLLMRIPVPWVFVLSYLVGVGLELVRPLAARSAVPLGVHVAGALLFGAGAAIAGWSWVLFRKRGTTRVPGEASTVLVTWGPYRASRNPMYVGLALAYLGEAGILGQVWPVLVLPLTLAYLNWLVIPVEEAHLQQVFRDEYEQYRAAVRRWV
jgi:protein-S-isoprenylcysteine O-methyltransferase Ste14